MAKPRQSITEAIDVLRAVKGKHTFGVLVGVFGGSVVLPGRLVIANGEFTIMARTSGDRFSAIAHGAMSRLPDACKLWHVQKMPRGWEASLKHILDFGAGAERINLGGVECRKVGIGNG